MGHPRRNQTNEWIMASVRIRRALALGATVLAMAAGSAGAQQSTPPEQQIRWVPAEWKKVCAQEGQENVCITSLEQHAVIGTNDKATPIAAAAIRDIAGRPEQRRLLIRTPLQVRLRQGVLYAIDTAEPKKMEFESCINIGCIATLPATDQLIASLKRGGELRLQFIGPSGRPVQVGVTLKGFTATLDGPGSKPETAAAKPAAPTSTLAPSRPSKGDAPPQ